MLDTLLKYTEQINKCPKCPKQRLHIRPNFRVCLSLNLLFGEDHEERQLRNAEALTIAVQEITWRTSDDSQEHSAKGTSHPLLNKKIPSPALLLSFTLNQRPLLSARWMSINIGLLKSTATLIKCIEHLLEEPKWLMHFKFKFRIDKFEFVQKRNTLYSNTISCL